MNIHIYARPSSKFKYVYDWGSVAPNTVTLPDDANVYSSYDEAINALDNTFTSNTNIEGDKNGVHGIWSFSGWKTNKVNDIIYATGSWKFAHNHEFNKKWVNDETNHWHECECGEKADITKHAYQETITKQPTHTETGIKTFTCLECGYTYTEVIKALEHNFGNEWINDETNHWHECECGEKSEVMAHEWKWVVDKEATETETGMKHEECKICGHAKTAVEIPMKPTEPKPPVEIKDDVPQTGDYSNVTLYYTLILLSGVSFISLLGILNKDKKVK